MKQKTKKQKQKQKKKKTKNKKTWKTLTIQETVCVCKNVCIAVTIGNVSSFYVHNDNIDTREN